MQSIMKQELYDQILEILSRQPTFNEGRRVLEAKMPHVLETVSDMTLKSMQAQFYVRRMRRCHHHHYSRETREKYYLLYKEAKTRGEENVILRLAAKNDISPCLLARIILEEYYWNDVQHDREKERGEGRASLPHGFMTDCIRDIAKLPNPELANEIYSTMVVDNFYGPAVDSIKKSCGVEYELILKSHCRKAGLSFIDENQMREEGYDKTPDVKLQIPVLINGRVVNWIESKASFGDPINHQQYMIDQYLPYKNRFGPGLVIYWFGFVAELAEKGERSILLRDRFPSEGEITRLKDILEKEKTLHGTRGCKEVEQTNVLASSEAGGAVKDTESVAKCVEDKTIRHMCCRSDEIEDESGKKCCCQCAECKNVRCANTDNGDSHIRSDDTEAKGNDNFSCQNKESEGNMGSTSIKVRQSGCNVVEGMSNAISPSTPSKCDEIKTEKIALSESDNDCEEEDKYYNYVDPMFDSD